MIMNNFSYIVFLFFSINALAFEFKPIHLDKASQSSSAAFSSDGRLIVLATENIAWVMDADMMLDVASIRHSGDVRYVSFNPVDSSKILTVTKNGMVNVWHVEKSKSFKKELSLPITDARHAAFSPDGTKIVTSGGSFVQIWNSSDGQLQGALGPKDDFSFAAYRPADNKIFTLNGNGIITLWDPTVGVAGIRIWTFDKYQWGLVSAAFSPDGKHIVLASNDQTARVIGTQYGWPELVLRGHKFRVKSAAYSPDGKRIVTASADGTAKVWDANTGAELFNLDPAWSEEEATSATFSPKNSAIIVVSYLNGPMREWVLPPDELVNPETLKLTIYAKIIKDFMETGREKMYRDFINFWSWSTEKTEQETRNTEQIIFNQLNDASKEYLNRLIPGRF